MDKGVRLTQVYAEKQLKSNAVERKTYLTQIYIEKQYKSSAV